MLNLSNNLHKTRCMGIFGVVDCKFDVRIENFKIADTRWRLFYESVLAIATKLGILGFLGSLIAILISVLQNYSPSQHNPELTT